MNIIKYYILGKTTLLKILSGLDKNYNGELKFMDSSLPDSSALKLKQSQRMIGWCPQNDALFEYLTVEEHILLFLDLLTTKELIINNKTSNIITKNNNDFILSDILSSLDMLKQKNKFMIELSGGMKRRLSLSLAMLGNPVVLFLDEPTRYIL